MSENTSPTEEEIKGMERQAERQMSSMERAMSSSMHDIMSHEEDLVKAGIDVEEIQAAADIAVERARDEYEENQANDPILNIGAVLEASINQSDESFLVKATIVSLEEARQKLVKGIGTIREEYVNRGEIEPEVIEMFNQAYSRGLIELTHGMDGIIKIPAVSVITIAATEKADHYVKLDDDLIASMLRNLGVAVSDEGLSQLGTAKTNIDGVLVNTHDNYQEKTEIGFYFTEEAIEKIIKLPTQ